MNHTILYPELEKKLKALEQTDISAPRQQVLQPLINYLQRKKDVGEAIKLNFICTHNSRRSQLAQVWAAAVSTAYGLEVQCFSGGTEATAFYKNAIAALNRAGFQITSTPSENPRIQVKFSENVPALECYSKVYDAPENPSEAFAAVMTCSHADENCPFIPGCEARVALDYDDPKEFDGTELADKKYDERSDQIASEMIYVFKNLK